MNTVVGTGLRAVGTVLEDIAESADIAGGTLEDTGVHVSNAAGADNAESVAVHLDLSRDIDDTPLTKGELAPGVGELSVDELGITIDGGEGTRDTIGERNPNGLASWDGGSDVRLNGIDPRASNAPDDQDQVLAGLVGELALVGTVCTDPGGSVGSVGVDTGRHDTERREFAHVSSSDGHITFPIEEVSLVL